MSKFEISLSKNDLEHIANGYDIKIKINGKRFLETNEIILKPALTNDVMAPILNYRFLYSQDLSNCTTAIQFIDLLSL